MSEKKQGQQLDIELPEEIAEGSYSNLVVIAHSNAEFILDFIRVLPGLPKARVKSRLIMTPQHAKRLLLALEDNIGKFEAQFGVIDLPEQPNLPMNFTGPTGEA